MSNKNSFILILLFFQSLIYSQQPHCFSWDSVKINSNSTRNFVSNVQKQTFQGPCISYAFVSAIETKYNIEFNNSNSNLVSLSVPYLDVKINTADMIDYKQTLQNHNFKIPVRKTSTSPETLRYSEFLPKINVITHPNYNGYYSVQTKQCINNLKHFRIKNYTTIPDGNDWKIDTSTRCDSESILNRDYLSVSEVTKLNPNSTDFLKETIIENGPVVMKVNGSVLSNFKSYNENVNYHAYTIIGWEDIDSNSTNWKLTDSWTDEDDIIWSKTISNSFLINLISNNNIEIYSVNGIKFKGNYSVVGFNVNAEIQCQDIQPEPEIVLSSIYVDIDYAFIGGYLYHKFWVTSNIEIDNWIWGIDYPNGSLKRSQVNNPNYSSVLLTPTTSGTVTVFVNGYKNGVKVTKEKRIYLSNGQSSGSGGW